MKEINIYTDGSHLDKQNNGRLGCGGIMVYNGKIINKFSIELKPDWLKKNIGTDQVSNPTAEMIGVLMALQQFDIPDDANVIIRADYIGVKAWMSGTWNTKEPYVKKSKELIQNEIKTKNLTGRIRFEWVKGHQPKYKADEHAKWNDIVDLLAKGQSI
jgi:ribonuclease HI